jgi:hypothetical protein
MVPGFAPGAFPAFLKKGVVGNRSQGRAWAAQGLRGERSRSEPLQPSGTNLSVLGREH